MKRDDAAREGHRDEPLIFLRVAVSPRLRVFYIAPVTPVTASRDCGHSFAIGGGSRV
jgi:hypothetical protein